MDNRESKIIIEFTNNNVGKFNTFFSGYNIGDIIGSYALYSYYNFQTHTGSTILQGGLVKLNNMTFVTQFYPMAYNDQLQYIYLDFTNEYKNNIAGAESFIISLQYPIINTVNSPNNPIEITFNPSNLTNKITITPITILTDEEISKKFNIPIPPNPPECFAFNTEILTTKGYKLIQDLEILDDIINGNNQIVKITKIKKYLKNEYNNQNIYCIHKNAFANNVPKNDLYITGAHAIKINNNYRHVKCLYKTGLYNISYLSNYTGMFYHVSTDNWEQDTIIAENLECETLCTNINLKWSCEKDICKYTIIKNNDILKKIMFYKRSYKN